MGDPWYKIIKKMEDIGKKIGLDSATKLKKAYLEHLIGDDSSSLLYVKGDRDSFYDEFNKIFPGFKLSKEEKNYMLSDDPLDRIVPTRFEGEELVSYNIPHFKVMPIEIDYFLISEIIISKNSKNKKDLEEVRKIFREITDKDTELRKNTPKPVVKTS